MLQKILIATIVILDVDTFLPFKIPSLDLSSMSVERLREITSDLDSQVSVYSEELLRVLNMREDLSREREAKNAFIAANVAVEEMINSRNSRLNRKRTGMRSIFRSESTGNALVSTRQWTLND